MTTTSYCDDKQTARYSTHSEGLFHPEEKVILRALPLQRGLSMDKIFINNLRVDTTIGIYQWERCVKQKVNFDIILACDTQEAAKKDTLEDTLDYAQISSAITDFVSHSRFKLIETLAHEVMEFLYHSFTLSGVQLKLSKPAAIKNAQEAGLIIQRGSLA